MVPIVPGLLVVDVIPPVKVRTPVGVKVGAAPPALPKVSPVTVADVAVDAVRSKVVHVVPSVETSIR